MTSAVVLTGWYVGYVITLVVIAAVVVLVAMILGLARRIGVQALRVTEALDEARIHTLALWDVAKVNDSLRGTIKRAKQARAALGGEQ